MSSAIIWDDWNREPYLTSPTPPKKPTCADTVLEVKARPKRVKVSKNKRKKLIELSTVLVSSQLQSHFHGTNSTPVQ